MTVRAKEFLLLSVAPHPNRESLPAGQRWLRALVRGVSAVVRTIMFTARIVVDRHTDTLKGGRVGSHVMKTPMANNVSHLQTEGEDCQSCILYRRERKLPPMRMVKIPATTERGIEIIICPWCDGDELIKQNGLEI